MSHRRILRDNINGITKSCMIRIAKIGEKYAEEFSQLEKQSDKRKIRLSNDILLCFHEWTIAFLTELFDPIYKGKDTKYFLKNIKLDIKYSFGDEDCYTKIIPHLPFERLIREKLQDYHDGKSYILSKDGLMEVKHFYVENAIRLFYTISINMGKKTQTITKENFLNGIKKIGKFNDPVNIGSSSESSDESSDSSDEEDHKPKKINKKKSKS